jgi:hypothetical protein
MIQLASVAEIHLVYTLCLRVLGKKSGADRIKLDAEWTLISLVVIDSAIVSKET